MAHELTLYFIPSPYGLTWDTPSSITKTTILNHLTLKNRNIGHVVIEIKTDKETILTGMSGDVRISKKLLFGDGIGMGMLYYNYPGSLESKADLEQELPIQVKDKRLNFVTFEISPETSARLITYYQEYRQNNHYKNYGLPNRPLYGEGSGCSAFAMSFVETAGLLENELIQAWSYRLKVPEKIIGAPINNKKVNVLKALTTFKWAYHHEEFREIFFWDPDTMFRWVEKKLLQPGPYQEIIKRGCKGISFDRTHVPTPTDAIWKN